jgi:hypothetical protein
MYPLVKHSPQRPTSSVLESEAGRLGLRSLGTEVPQRGPGAELLVGVWGKAPEAERLSRFWRVISTLNPTLKVIYRLEIWNIVGKDVMVLSDFCQ